MWTDSVTNEHTIDNVLAAVTDDKFQIIETVPINRNTDVLTTDSEKGEFSSPDEQTSSCVNHEFGDVSYI